MSILEICDFKEVGVFSARLKTLANFWNKEIAKAISGSRNAKAFLGIKNFDINVGVLDPTKISVEIFNKYNYLQ